MFPGLSIGPSEPTNAPPSVVLPGDLFSQISETEVDFTVGAYSSPVLFQQAQQGNGFEVASTILTISLGRGIKVENLTSGVNITMTLLSEVS